MHPISNGQTNREKVVASYLHQRRYAVKKSSFIGKFKVSVRKLIKLFGQPAWLILMPDKSSWYTIQRIYWRNTLKEKKDSFVNNNLKTDSNQRDGFWLRNENFYLKVEDKNILLSSNAWLNDKIMDA